MSDEAPASSVMDRKPAVIGDFMGSSITAGDYLHTRAWLHGDRFAVAKAGNRAYTAEEPFWLDAFESNVLFETQRVLLRDFVLVDWIPRSPGRYHSGSAEGHARRRQTTSWGRQPSRIDTASLSCSIRMGKARWSPAGGCLRVAIKTIGAAEVKLLSASSSGMAHAGIVVAVRAADYASLGGSIAENGGVRCSLSGELRYWNADKYLPVGATVGIPRIYLHVSDIDSVSSNLPQLDATPAIVFSTEGPDYFGNFYAYTHIDPSDNSALDRCVEWMQENYIEARYNGRVLTDFDETRPRFSATACALRDLLDPNPGRL